jgi:hypothetical protein
MEYPTVTADSVPSSLILVTLMMEAIHSSKMWVLTSATWHNIPEDGILHSTAVKTSNLTKRNLLHNVLYPIEAMIHEKYTREDRIL